MQQQLTGVQSFKLSFLIQTTETPCISEQTTLITAQWSPLEENTKTMSHKFSTLSWYHAQDISHNTRTKQRRSLHKHAHKDIQRAEHTSNKQTDWISVSPKHSRCFFKFNA